MKANELRLGNLVSLNGTEHTVNCATIVYQKSTHKCDPIPLTEEWLVKFGFKGSAKNVKFELCFHSMKLRFHFRYDKLICHLVGVPINLHVYSIHQLQNLYFALTGEELILKP